MTDESGFVERLRRYIQRWRIKRAYVNAAGDRMGKRVGFSPIIKAYLMMERDGIVSMDDGKIVWLWPEDYIPRINEAEHLPAEVPNADPCERCGRQMEVLRYETDGTILWQECEDCEVGWSPGLGFHELEEIEG